MDANDWLRVDEQTDVLVSLDECLNCVRRVHEEPAFWKWAILSIHNALQGAIVCHLSGTAQLGALAKRSVIASLEWHERDRGGEIKKVLDGSDEWGLPVYRLEREEDAFPDQWLADPGTLFERLHREDRRCEGGAGAVIAVTREQRKSFRRLTSLRKNFAHFTPRGWSIELAGLPGILLDVLGVIDRIAADPWPFRHMDDQARERLERILPQLRSELALLET